MAFKLKKDVKKSSYYVWFLGSKESNGLRGNEYIIPILNEFIEKEKTVEPFKITLQISHKGIKIIQNISENPSVAHAKKNDLIKHFIPQHSITCVHQHEDIVSMIMLLYNPLTKCPLHVHAYRCDSVETATILTKQLTVIIERPENVKKINDMEMKMINKGVIHTATAKYAKQSLSTRESETSGTSSGSGTSALNDKVINLYDCLTAELKLKLNKDIDQAPILLPPKDYDTVRRKRGNPVDMRRCVNMNVVGMRNNNNSSNSSGIGSDHAHSPCSLHNDSTSDEDWNIEQSEDFEAEDPSAELANVLWSKDNRDLTALEKPWNRKNINNEWSKTDDEYIQNNLNNRNNRLEEVDNRYSKNKDVGRNLNKDIDIKRNIVNREYLPKESNRVERQPSRLDKDRELVDLKRNFRRVDLNERVNQIAKSKEKSFERDSFAKEEQFKSNFVKTNSNNNLFAMKNEDHFLPSDRVPSFVKQMKSTSDEFEKNYDQRHIGKNYYENRQRSPSPDDTSPRDRFMDAKQKFKLLEKERLEEEKKLIQQNIEKKIKERERPKSPVPVNKNNIRRSWSVESEENKLRDNRLRHRDLDERIKRQTELENEERARRNWEDEMKRKTEERERDRALQEKERLARQKYKENQSRIEMIKSPGRYAPVESSPSKLSREPSSGKEYYRKEMPSHQSKPEQIISHGRERSYQDLRHVSDSPTRMKDMRRESPTRGYSNFSRDSPTRGAPFRDRPVRDSPTRSVSSWDLPLRDSPVRVLPVESPSKKLSPRELLLRDAQEVRAAHDLKTSKEMKDNVIPGKYPAKEQLKKLPSRESKSPVRESSRSSDSPVCDYPSKSQSSLPESRIKYSPRNVPLESIPLERYRSPTRFDSPKSLGYEITKPHEELRPHHEMSRSFDPRGRDVPSRPFDTYDAQGRGEISRHKILENSKKATPDPIEEEKRRYSQELAKEFKRKSMLNLNENSSHASSGSYQELHENERYPGLDKEPSRQERFERDRLERPLRNERDRVSDEDMRHDLKDPRAPQRFERNRMERNLRVDDAPKSFDPRMTRDPRDHRMERDPRAQEREYREHRDPRLEMRDQRRYEREAREPRFEPDSRLAQHMHAPRYRHSYAEAYHRDLQRTNSCLSSGRVGIASIHPY